ncbi:MAG: FeoB-associated Cys-rich membrane protein [Candidatus Electrothrix sp. LOE2]|nr:FeoB-associated Cys-rich membrane protein [Candidatus Electrothrix sp. LOE2]
MSGLTALFFAIFLVEAKKVSLKEKSMQNLIVVFIVLAACFFVGRSLFRSCRSGTCSGGRCSGCGKDSGSACSPQSEQANRKGKRKGNRKR